MTALFHCRLTAPGWANFTGNFGFQTPFVKGRSVHPLTPRQIARIGSTTVLVNDETGMQVGPSVIHFAVQSTEMNVPTPLKNAQEGEADAEAERERLAAAEKAQKEADAAALAEAQAKAQAAVDEAVVYSRAELEAIGANDGIAGLREIAKPLNVKGRGIVEMVNEILAAQAKLAVA